MAATNFVSIRRKLLRWYDGNKRGLPWRRTRDPYAVWIAEIMLQQTQVKTVLPYYEKFLHDFPSVDALERAPLERILRAWSGLGYYRRAENLKKAAGQIKRDYGSRLPRDYNKLCRLAGIGSYTAGAILSIAFQRRYPAVDGNVRRVLGRLFALSDEKGLHANAAALVPRSRPGDFNQALMELGALLCAPQEPRCSQCPLSSECAARQGRDATLRYRSHKRGNDKNVVWPLAIVRCRGKILLRRRASRGLLARLWELPGGEAKRPGRVAATLRDELADLGPVAVGQRAIAEIRHHITYRRIRAPIFLIECPPAVVTRLRGTRWRWIAPDEIRDYAVSSMTAKALKTLAQ